jgi:hypothetical protein
MISYLSAIHEVATPVYFGHVVLSRYTQRVFYPGRSNRGDGVDMLDITLWCDGIEERGMEVEVFGDISNLCSSSNRPQLPFQNIQSPLQLFQ